MKVIITIARPKINKVTLTDDKLEQLKKLLKKKDTSSTICSRCRILIVLDENHPPVQAYDQCMTNHNVSRAAIADTVNKYASEGLEVC